MNKTTAQLPQGSAVRGHRVPGSAAKQQPRQLVTNTTSAVMLEDKSVDVEEKESCLAGNSDHNICTPLHTQHLVARILNWRPVYQKNFLFA